MLAVVVAALVGGEFYARNQARSRVSSAVQCEVQDSATASFATAPLLWQFITKHYPDIAVETGGNQVRDAKGMKISIDIRNMRLNPANNSAGTIESVKGTITWSKDGIKQSIQDAIPMIGSLVTGEVTTNPSDGTVSLKGLLDSATLKPQIVNNGVSLQVVSLSALGSDMSTDSVQTHLDDLTSKATKDYPLGIHADSVKVTDSGIEATFSASNATIPAGGGKDACFVNYWPHRQPVNRCRAVSFLLTGGPCVRDACTPASSKAGAALLRALLGSGECGVVASPVAWRPPPSR